MTMRPTGSTPPALLRALEHGAVVQLEDAHLAGRGGGYAELAEHALVEVLLDHLDLAVARGIDVDGAGVLELLGRLRVAADVVGHFDVDERAGHGLSLHLRLDLLLDEVRDL